MVSWRAAELILHVISRAARSVGAWSIIDAVVITPIDAWGRLTAHVKVLKAFLVGRLQ